MRMEGQKVIDRCRGIVEAHQAEKVGGVFIDSTTAHAVVQVYDAVSASAREKLCLMMEKEGIVNTVGFVWKLIERSKNKAG